MPFVPRTFPSPRRSRPHRPLAVDLRPGAGSAEPRAPLLCDFDHRLAVRAGRPMTQQRGQRMGARVSRSGRLHCLLPSCEGSHPGSARGPALGGETRPPPAPEVETPTDLSAKCGASAAAEEASMASQEAPPPPPVRSFGFRPISGLTKRHNERVYRLLNDPETPSASPPGSPTSLASADAAMSPRSKAARVARVALALRLPGMAAAAARKRAADTSGLSATERMKRFDRNVAEVLSTLGELELRKELGGRRAAAEAASAAAAASTRPATAAGTSAPAPKKTAEHESRPAPRPSRIVAPALLEEDFWFLDDEQVVLSPTAEAKRLTAHRRRKAERTQYSMTVVRVLRSRPEAIPAFSRKVARCRAEKRAQLLARGGGVAEDYFRRNRVDAARSPREREQEREQRLQSEAERQRRALQAAREADEELAERRHRAQGYERRNRITRGKAFQMLMVHIAAHLLLGERVKVWRSRLEGTNRWTENRRRIRMMRDAANNLRQLHNCSPTEQRERVQNAVLLREQGAEQLATQLLVRHLWIVRLRVRIARKSRAADTIRNHLQNWVRKTQVAFVVKKLTFGTRKLQRWWKRQHVLAAAEQRLRIMQWTLYVNQHTSYDAARLRTVFGLGGGPPVPSQQQQQQQQVERVPGGPNRVPIAQATTAAQRRKQARTRRSSSAVRQGFGHAGVPQTATGGAAARPPPSVSLDLMSGVDSRPTSPVAPPPVLRRSQQNASSSSEKPTPTLFKPKHSDYGQQKWHRDILSQAAAARDTIRTLHANTIEFDPPQRIRDAILKLQADRERRWFRARLRTWEEQMEAARDEYKQLKTLLDAKKQIQPLTKEDTDRVALFKWPDPPYYHRILQPNEVRLCIALAYREHLVLAKAAAARKCERFLALAVEADDEDDAAAVERLRQLEEAEEEDKKLPPALTEEKVFCEKLHEVQAEIGLGGVFEGFWVPVADLRSGLVKGSWMGTRQDHSTQSTIKKNLPLVP
eukprot:TRINITY_DN1595_c0_g1_i9.p1 TRINITY_DN1595_c0_g1~~TRINITY_DN1595_c0_g1_i9.p1  ORF type:complete len:1012 (+),score=244.33 TRINITY_DN1595_c0_g1_i9:83-3037(+)